MSTNTRSERTTARKIVGSLAIVGTAAAVAGLGTYGNFTDSTTPLNTSVETGTLSINLNAGPVAVPASTSNFVPGDSMSRAVDLVNDGSVALGALSVTSAVTTASNLLTTDASNGLQLTVQRCSTAWTQGGTTEAPTYSCAGTVSTILTGPVANSAPLTGPASLAAGGVDHLVFTVSLPTSAGNEFQGLDAGLSLTFTGVQRAGQAR